MTRIFEALTKSSSSAAASSSIWLLQLLNTQECNFPHTLRANTWLQRILPCGMCHCMSRKKWQLPDYYLPLLLLPLRTEEMTEENCVIWSGTTNWRWRSRNSASLDTNSQLPPSQTKQRAWRITGLWRMNLTWGSFVETGCWCVWEGLAWSDKVNRINHLSHQKQFRTTTYFLVWSGSLWLQLNTLVQGTNFSYTVMCATTFANRKQHPDTAAITYLGSSPCILLLLYGVFFDSQMRD